VIGLVMLLLVIGLFCFFYQRNKAKFLKQDLFDGEAYCHVVQKLRKGNYLGKRKTYPALAFTKEVLTQKQINELYNFYNSEQVKPKQQALIKQCYLNLRSKGIDVPVLDEESEMVEEYDEEEYGDEAEDQIEEPPKQQFQKNHDTHRKNPLSGTSSSLQHFNTAISLN